MSHIRSLGRVLSCMPLVAWPAAAQTSVWQQQFGGAGADSASALAPDGVAGFFAAGFTFGSLAAANAGGPDVWIARRDSSGTELWMRQFGTSDYEAAEALATEPGGGAYVGGFTYGAVGGPNAGDSDAWLARYSGAGARAWIVQAGSSAADTLHGAAPDGAGGVFVCGNTDGDLAGANQGGKDAWIARYSGGAAQLWARHLGSVGYDHAAALASDGAGGLYVCGGTDGTLGGPGIGSMDAWLARYDSAGNPLWTVKLGTTDFDFAAAATPDGVGGVCIAGYSYGDLGGPSAGDADAWLARYDAAGNRLWARQIGTDRIDIALAVVVDALGRIAVSGNTDGDLAAASAGPGDAWIASYDLSGVPLWSVQFGSASSESSASLAGDATGGLFVSGATFGDLAAPNAGDWDAWIARFGPATLASYCTAKVNSLGCTPAISGQGTPSATASSGFVVRSVNMRNNKAGLLFYSNGGRAASPFTGGTLCVGGALKRVQGLSSGGTPSPVNDCSGVFSVDVNAFRAGLLGGNPNAFLSVVGTVVTSQFWGRDPGFTAPDNTQLSDGLEFTVGP